MQRLSCSTICFKDYSLEDALEAIESLGFRYVDIGAMPGFCPHFNFFDATPEQERGFIRSVRGSSLAVHTFTAHIGDFNEDGADSAEYRRAGVRSVRMAADLGAYAVNLNCGKYYPRLERSFAADVRTVAANIAAIADEAHACGVDILIEAPHKGKLIRNVLEAEWLLHEIDRENVKLIFDVNHHHAAGWRPDDVIARVGRRIGLVHLRDAAGRDNKYPLGTGEIDFRLLVSALASVQYGGLYSFEFTGAADTMEGNKEMIRQSVEYFLPLLS